MNYKKRGERVGDFKFLDSSVWIAFIIENKNKEIIGTEEPLALCSLSLFEIKRKLINDKVKKEDIERSISFIKNRSMVINVDEKIAEKAAEISVERKVPSLDALIYCTSLQNEGILFTRDNDFRGLPLVNILS